MLRLQSPLRTLIAWPSGDSGNRFAACAGGQTSELHVIATEREQLDSQINLNVTTPVISALSSGGETNVPIASLAATNSGLLAATDMLGHCTLYRIPEESGESQAERIAEATGEDVLCVASDGSSIALALRSNSIEMRNANDGFERKSDMVLEPCSLGTLQCLSIPRFGSQTSLIAGGVGGVAVFDLRSPKSEAIVLKLAKINSAHSVDAFGTDAPGTPVVAGCADGVVRLWDMRKSESPAFAAASHDHWVYSVACKPGSSSVVASGGSDGRVCVFDTVQADVRPSALTGSGTDLAGDDSIRALAWSADGSLLASASFLGEVQVRRAPSAKH